MIEASLHRLQTYIEDENYRGYDPYDALSSPLFDLPVFRSSKLLRFGAQQLVKRFPVNLRPLLWVPKGLNPVTLGLMIQGYGYLTDVYPEREDEYRRKILTLSETLREMNPEGFSGSCWGYDFDWEARHAKIPAYQPTVVATGIITNALFQAWKTTGLDSLKSMVLDAVPFVLKDLNRNEAEDGICFSYSPFDRQQVFNASMKGVRLLAQAYSLNGDDELKKVASNAVRFVVSHQHEDGSWHYSLAKKGNWVDSYHTGYVLDCLDEYMMQCDDDRYREEYDTGYKFYRDTFIGPNGMPFFYSHEKYPADCTSASQTIQTLIRNGDIDLAEKVATWMIQQMQAEDGSFYFRIFKWYINKTSFMRWSNAWMFAALAFLLNYKKTLK